MKVRNDRSKGINTPKTRKQGFLPVIAFLVVVVALSTSCGRSKPPKVLPEGAEKCSGESGTYTCPGTADHEITITDVPEKVAPYRLPVPSEREQELRKADKEGTECIFAVVGDLAFYDTDNNLVTDFSETPLTITYSFTEYDVPAFEECTKSILEKKLVQNPTEIQYLPIYFSNQKWTPFPVEDYTVDGNTVTVRITSWGDQPLGGGTQP